MPCELSIKDSRTVAMVWSPDLKTLLVDALSSVNTGLMANKEVNGEPSGKIIPISLTAAGINDLFREFLNECLYMSNVNKELYKLTNIKSLSDTALEGEIQAFYVLEKAVEFPTQLVYISVFEEYKQESDSAKISLIFED
jgi:hypothetical protein